MVLILGCHSIVEQITKSFTIFINIKQEKNLSLLKKKKKSMLLGVFLKTIIRNVLTLILTSLKEIMQIKCSTKNLNIFYIKTKLRGSNYFILEKFQEKEFQKHFLYILTS